MNYGRETQPAHSHRRWPLIAAALLLGALADRAATKPATIDPQADPAPRAIGTPAKHAAGEPTAPDPPTPADGHTVSHPPAWLRAPAAPELAPPLPQVPPSTSTQWPTLGADPRGQLRARFGDTARGAAAAGRQAHRGLGRVAVGLRGRPRHPGPRSRQRQRGGHAERYARVPLAGFRFMRPELPAGWHTASVPGSYVHMTRGS